MCLVLFCAVSGRTEEEKALLQQCRSLWGGVGRQGWHCKCKTLFKKMISWLFSSKKRFRLNVFGSATLLFNILFSILSRVSISLNDPENSLISKHTDQASNFLSPSYAMLWWTGGQGLSLWRWKGQSTEG